MAKIASELEKRVRTALDQDSRIDAAEIDVVDDNGVITLTGTVASEEVREAAEKVVNDQKGVLEVINDLALGSEEHEDAEEYSPTWPPNM